MADSIGNAKCPSALASGNYNMSQSPCADESKEYIFVKLTDSAYRAVEEYQRNKNSRRFLHGQCAKIQLIGNSGVIHFPTPDTAGNDGGGGGGGTSASGSNSNDGRQFSFAIDDVEGSLECVQQKQKELDVLGSLSYRMRIQANDDVYDTTRTKMAIAEETEKSKCIREIKPNQAAIGRKVKKQKPHLNQFQNNNNNNCNNQNNNFNNQNTNNGYNLNSNNNQNNVVGNPNNVSNSIRDASPLNSNDGSNMNNSSGGDIKMGSTPRSPSTRYGNTSSNNSSALQWNTSNLSTAASPSSTLENGIANSNASVSTGPSESTISASPSSLSMATSKKLNAGGGLKGLIGGSGAKMPNIIRHNIRERLVHLLALKPFKKPELYARLQNEGLRTRERSAISKILKDISTMSRENTYILRSQIWNEVNEDWPFYTEQELQLLKSRRPQKNRTPPVNSDPVSSTSGQSRTPTHTGCPPPLLPSNLVGYAGDGGVGAGAAAGGGRNINISQKANMEGDRYDDSLQSSVQPKRQRICPANNLLANGVSSCSPSPKNNTNTPNTEENFGDFNRSYNSLDSADHFMPSLEPNNVVLNNESGGNGGFNNNNSGNDNRQRQSPNDIQQNNQQNNKGSYGCKSSKSKSHSGKGNSPRSSSYKKKDPSHCPNDEIAGNRDPSSNGPKRSNKSSRMSMPPMRQPPSTNDVVSSYFDHHYEQQQQPQQPQQQQQHQSQQHASPAQQIAAVASICATASSSTSGNKPMYDFSNYTRITTIEQRRQYRTEFQGEYDEYQKLFTRIESVGKRFRGLAERLENVQQGCPEFNDIRQQIVNEYQRVRNAEPLRRDKQRFDYLHEKLGILKQLVTDYDKTLTSDSGGSSSGNSSNLNISPLLENSTATTITTETTRSLEQVSDNVEKLPAQQTISNEEHQRHNNYKQQEKHQKRHLHHAQQDIASTTSSLAFDNHYEITLDSNQHYMDTSNANSHNNGSNSNSTSNQNKNNATDRDGQGGVSNYESNSDDSSDSDDNDDDSNEDDDDENDNDSDDKFHQEDGHDLYSKRSNDDNKDRY